ncbi:hypothetical protein BS78_02G147400 [Paspalum vaginatum]|nr:hypothetical protein BS78_02G147400 [Paspalum vaginatum]
MMEAAAAAMLEAGVGRFSRAPAMAAALLAEMWAPLAVALAALATLPSLLRRLQLIVLRIRSRGKEVIQSHIGTYYSSSGEDDEDEGDSSDGDGDSSASCSSSGDEKDREHLRRIGFYEADAGGFPWGGAVVRTWQGFSGRVSAASGGGALSAGAANGAPQLPPAAVRLWRAGTASGEPWWTTSAGADDGGCRPTEAEARSGDRAVVVGWNAGRDHTQAAQKRRRRRAASSSHG